MMGCLDGRPSWAQCTLETAAIALWRVPPLHLFTDILPDEITSDALPPCPKNDIMLFELAWFKNPQHRLILDAKSQRLNLRFPSHGFHAIVRFPRFKYTCNLLYNDFSSSGEACFLWKEKSDMKASVWGYGIIGLDKDLLLECTNTTLMEDLFFGV